MDIWVATTNQGKLNEFRNILSPHGFTIRSPADLPVYSAPKEDGKTFEDNARIKARTMRAIKPGTWATGEDSGLEVEGLGNMPGIFSARYAGDKASDGENNAKVLKMVQIRTPMNRKAQFHCCLIAYSPEGKEFIFEGIVNGEITTSAKGTSGFGYDPIFIPEGQTQTFAELGVAYKNQVSHRAQAIRQLLETISKSL